MKYVGRRKSKNVIDATNTSGKFHRMTEAQKERAFRPKETVNRQKNSNAAKNNLRDGDMGKIVKDASSELKKRRMSILNQPAPSSRDRLSSFKKRKK